MSGLIPYFGIAQGSISSSVLVQVCYLDSTLAQVIIIVSSKLCKWEDFIFGHLNLTLQE